MVCVRQKATAKISRKNIKPRREQIQAKAQVSARWQVNFWFWKHRDGAIDDQTRVSIGIERGQVNQAAGDAALRRVDGAQILRKTP